MASLVNSTSALSTDALSAVAAPVAAPTGHDDSKGSSISKVVNDVRNVTKRALKKATSTPRKRNLCVTITAAFCVAVGVVANYFFKFQTCQFDWPGNLCGFNFTRINTGAHQYYSNAANWANTHLHR
jgi:hypothetical protein